MLDPKIQEMIDLAAGDVERLVNATTCDEARAAWIAFLEHANRAINRVQGLARRTNQEPKYKALLEEVWADDLAKYMRTARNTHEHGVVDTEVSEPYAERLAFPDGGLVSGPIVVGTNAAGEEVWIPASGPGQIFGGDPRVRKVSIVPTVRMIPVVTERGEKVMPPFTALASEDEPEPAAAARAYLAWVTSKVAAF